MIVKRFEMLAEIMRFKTSIAISGTHGKTTTTSLMASMIEYCGLNPTVINGGIINNKETNAYLGDGDFLVVEADESDATFIKIPATIAVITNIDPEHLDFYGSFEEVKKAFRTFVQNVPFYGFAVLCVDHPEVYKISEEIKDRKVITYALDQDADIKAINIRSTSTGSIFDVEIKGALSKNPYVISDITLPIFGRHNILNSLSVIATAVKLGFDEKIIKDGFKQFQGVKRRFTKVGTVNNVSIIDDYAHHPVELRATLNTARSVAGSNKVIAVFQPHRFSRVKDLFEDFANSFGNVDHLVISDIYTAGELPIEGINKENLSKKIKEYNSKLEITLLDDPENIAEIVKKSAHPGDMVIFLGAGSVTYWAYKLPEQLSKILA